MLKFCKILFASLFLSTQFASTTEASYDVEITPEVGWERFSGDAARSVEGWLKWWRYLRMKESESIVMNWINGLVIVIHPKNEIYRAIYVRGIYDPNLIVVINALLPKDGVFVDAGANMGYVSLLASGVVGEKGRIFALEPSSRDFSRLLENINANNLGKVIFAYRLALSDKIGKEKLSIAAEERSGLNTLAPEISFKGVDKIKVEEIDAATLDSFVKNEKINRIDALKLDVEGGELRALKGAENTIKKYRPAIILGINRGALEACGANRLELQKIIVEMKYKIYKIAEEPVFRLEPVEDLESVDSNVVVCLPEGAVPPTLPQAKKRSFLEKVSDFFA